MLGLMLTSHTDILWTSFLRQVKEILLMTFFQTLTQSVSIYKLTSGISIQWGVVPQKGLIKCQCSSQKSCKLLWQRWEEDMREQTKPKESWRFYLDIVYPKYHYSSPALSLPTFRTLWKAKMYSSHNHLEKTYGSILAVPPELTI